MGSFTGLCVVQKYVKYINYLKYTVLETSFEMAECDYIDVMLGSIDGL